jgi:hypothetical protein
MVHIYTQYLGEILKGKFKYPTNINKSNYHLSPQIIEHKEDHDI